eukprot:570866_1
MANYLYGILICTFASLCYYLLFKSFLRYKSIRMWQTKGKMTHAIVTSKWKLTYESDKKRNQYLISYSFKCKEQTIQVDKMLIGDVEFWDSLSVSASFEVIYIESEPQKYNIPQKVRSDRCKEAVRILMNVLFSFVLFFSDLILSVAVCHYKWDEILFTLFVYPGIILILFTLGRLHCFIGHGNAESFMYYVSLELLSIETPIIVCIFKVSLFNI